MSPSSPSNRPWLWRLSVLWRNLTRERGLIFSLLMFGALLAFELFNYITADVALTDLLGDIRFLGLRWAMVLALAFCAMDFAGVARLFAPERQANNRTEVWYLLAAWFLSAGMNALLTWWGVSLALLSHADLGNEILSRDQLLTAVPIFVAVLVLLIRVLIIGTFSMAGERLFARAEAATGRPAQAPAAAPARPMPAPAAKPAPRPAPRPEDWEAEFDQRPRPTAEAYRPNPEPYRQPAEAYRPAPPTPMRPTNPPPVQTTPTPRPAPKPAPKPVVVGGPRNGTPLNGHHDED